MIILENGEQCLFCNICKFSKVECEGKMESKYDIYRCDLPQELDINKSEKEN